MRVRMVQQVSGTRDGASWPAPGTEVDLPDFEARALISGGAAVGTEDQGRTVLVPPAGVHVPGRTAMPADAVAPLVEVPADAVSYPDQTRDALTAHAEGNYVEGPAGVAHQQATGLAHTSEGLDAAAEDERRTREDFAASTPTVGEKPAKATPAKAADSGPKSGDSGPKSKT